MFCATFSSSASSRDDPCVTPSRIGGGVNDVVRKLFRSTVNFSSTPTGSYMAGLIAGAVIASAQHSSSGGRSGSGAAQGAYSPKVANPGA